MSPLVPGFYTDDYAKEVDRRCRLMNGKGLAKAGDQNYQVAVWCEVPADGWR